MGLNTMLPLFVLVLLVTNASSRERKCSCFGFSCLGYGGSAAACYCWAQKTSNQQKTSGNIYYAARSGLARGECQYCPTGPGDGNSTVYITTSYCNPGKINGKCTMFLQSGQVCLDWCKRKANSTKMIEPINCEYVPRTQFSSASCFVKGQQAACSVS